MLKILKKIIHFGSINIGQKYEINELLENVDTVNGIKVLKKSFENKLPENFEPLDYFLSEEKYREFMQLLQS